MNEIGLIWRTVRHLHSRQIRYQVINRLRGRAQLRLPDSAPVGYFLAVPEADKPVSWVNGTFTFLNLPVSFDEEPDLRHEGVTTAASAGESAVDVLSPQGVSPDWNFADNGKLWTYNLNYFDFLNQPGLTADEGLALIQAFIGRTDTLKDGLEPYPASLRIINWVQFLSRNRIQDEEINRHLFAQTDLLRRRLEYHLAGNHLLENGFALLIGALYFRQADWFQQAARLTRAELEIQVLADGGHDERSPMYHQILLDRLLDVVLALQADNWHEDSELVDFLVEKGRQMLGWLEAVTFANGDVPMVNDAAWDIAPTTDQLREKASLVLAAGAGPVSKTALGQSGYRMLRLPRYELLADVGAVGPDHQPGHAHADTLSFVLYVDGQPVIVDSGTSTYQISPRRTWERSTTAHNTVEVGGQDSSEVWGGFRVGRRARVTLLADTDTVLAARHDGYRHLGITHERSWDLRPGEIRMNDLITGSSTCAISGMARLYIHPAISVRLAGDTALVGPLRLNFRSDRPVVPTLSQYDMATGFNQWQSGSCLSVLFVNRLHTQATLIE
ncbi:alginate lyase family protein [Spirosoma taeanense]|uniref:Alginate lyase family protein n=1 Tax=Spirosoma taeanense TaxID=2735870 RepID=A0A6M5YCZ1_9BACT|nr:alginate lyase family protein [Spirosoma taeanense]QJW91166.1 alginate lyase family protein [Spirosoma taeanense]